MTGLSRAIGHFLLHARRAANACDYVITSLTALLGKTWSYCQRRGFWSTFERALTVLLRKDAYKNYIRRARRVGASKIFVGIYEQNIWRNNESVSGHGSTLEYTKGLRESLPSIFDALQIKSVVDAPCGDFNWMRQVPMEGMRYFGIDIVPGLIEDNKQKFSTPDISFICADISNATFPDADLFFCRDCLFHLSFEDIRGVLTSFCKSNLKYLMTTTHMVPYRFSNYDIATGDFRVIDLFKPPFSFPEDVLFRVEDYRPPDLPRAMCVWSAEQVCKSRLFS
jgi:SAM-dependent methyltransferase